MVQIWVEWSKKDNFLNGNTCFFFFGMVWLHLHTLLSKQGRKEELWGHLQEEKHVKSSEVIMAPSSSEEKSYIDLS